MERVVIAFCMPFIRNKKVAFIVIVFILLVLGLTLIVLRQQQETRSKAAKSTTLSLTPASLQASVGNPVNFDIMLSPGSNLVSFLKLEITYDPAILTPATTPLVVDQTIFPQTLEGPIVQSGKIIASLSVGPDPSRVINQAVKVGTVSFVAAANTNTPSVVQFGNNTLVLSVAPADAGAENVIANTIPAQVTVSDTALCVQPTQGPPDTNIIPFTLLGSNEVPPNSSQAVGYGWLFLNGPSGDGGENATVSLCVSGITSGTTSAHIHGPAPVGQNAGILHTLNLGPQGSFQTTTITLSATELGDLNVDNLYVNVHSNDFPGGEIRAQLQPTQCLNPEGCTTPTLTPSPTVSPTIQPTVTPMPTVTIPPGQTSLAMSFFLHGIWPSGDNVNPTNNFANKTPQFPQRTIDVDVLDNNNVPIPGSPFSGVVTYDPITGKFNTQLAIGTAPTGSYTIAVKTDRYLSNLYPGIQTLTVGQSNPLNTLTLTAGDIVNDDALSIQDYNVLRDCGYKAAIPLPMTDPSSQFNSAPCLGHPERADADLDDNAIIDQSDYGLFLRELSVQTGRGN